MPDRSRRRCIRLGALRARRRWARRSPCRGRRAGAASHATRTRRFRRASRARPRRVRSCRRVGGTRKFKAPFRCCSSTRLGDHELFVNSGGPPPKQHQYEIRCYIRDPDGHLIEVRQTTDPEGDWRPAHWPSISAGGDIGGCVRSVEDAPFSCQSQCVIDRGERSVTPSARGSPPHEPVVTPVRRDGASSSTSTTATARGRGSARTSPPRGRFASTPRGRRAPRSPSIDQAP